MLGCKEYLPTACIDGHNIRVRVVLSCVPHIFFYAIFLVETSFFIKFIDKNELSAVLNHTMTGIALKSKDRIVRIFPEKANKVRQNGSACFHARLHQDFLVFKSKAETSNKLFKCIEVIMNGLQVWIHWNISVFRFSDNFLYLIEYWHSAEES